MYKLFVKRLLDIILVLAALVVALPVMLLVAVAIVIEDPGPVFFTQKRVGKGKRHFKILKFRSMKVSTPKDTPTHLLENPECSPFLQSLCEVTLGCQSLIAAQIPFLLPLICFFTAFSGFSILLQNAAFLSDHGISLKNLIIYGLLRGLIAFLLCFAILLCHPAIFAV